MAAAFDGTGDYLSCAAFDLPATGSISFWYRPTYAYTDGLYHFIFETYKDANNLFNIAKYSDSTWNVGWYTAGEYRLVGASASGLTQNAWNHLLVTWDDTANETKFFLNNSQVGSTVTSLVTHTGTVTVYIGSQVGATTRDASGRIAELAVFSSVLDAGQRNALYKGFAPPLVAKPFRYWPLLRNFQEMMTAGSISNTGVTVEDHPPIIYPSSARAA